MMDEQEAAMVQDWDALASGSARNATARVLTEVGLERRLDDDREGSFRDYADTSGACVALWNDARQKEAAITAEQGTRPWLAQLFAATGYVWVVLTSGRARKLRPALLRVAAVAVAWAEALDVRTSEQEAELALRPKRTLWQRLVAWVRRWRR